MRGRVLKNRRVAVIAADGFEEVELTAPVKALRAAGANVDIISLRPGKIRAMNHHKPSRQISVDRSITDAQPANYDALLIPGGLISPDMLRQSEEVRDFVRKFDRQRKPIAAICHGPWILASSDLLEGRTLTSWPAIRDDLVNAGAIWIDREVVRDGNWVTSRSPMDMDAFISAMTNLFSQSSPIQAARNRASTSSPRTRQLSPDLLNAMKESRLPSARTFFELMAVVAGLFFILRRQSERSVEIPMKHRRRTAAETYSPSLQ